MRRSVAVRYVVLLPSILLLGPFLWTLCQSRGAFDSARIKEYTRNVTIKQGRLQGVVVEFRDLQGVLKPVEQYRGIPYAAPPVGGLRFMPPGSAPSWFGTKFADTFGPVCPQLFPDPNTMMPEQREKFVRLKPFLLNQSEDCLYLNVYAPYQDRIESRQRYPVIVFLHGDSFEWSSGNPYDGSVLAAYGKVVVVTLNFRLGVLGFLKTGTEKHAKSNFGLIDQIAALLWVKENIVAFGGDPNAVTLWGQGSGAVCASLLMFSPMVPQEQEKRLFRRVILMGGTALADWALATNPLEVTYQMAQSLNCQLHNDFAECLRHKRLEDLIKASSTPTPAYHTKFGPVVDALVVPLDPRKTMESYPHAFRKYEMLYGVAEHDNVDHIRPTFITQGMLEKERDEELRKYLRLVCEVKSDVCLLRTLSEYGLSEHPVATAKALGKAFEPTEKMLFATREKFLNILSDARAIAPIVQMGQFHCILNPDSYFYVYAHKTGSRDYLRNGSFNGDELPYVFGVPLDGPKFHFVDHYTERERLFSETIMTYISNFAYTGSPNVPRHGEYFTLNPIDWLQFDVDWPEFDMKQQRYLRLAIPPKVLHHYRHKEVTFWNAELPDLIKNRTSAVPTAIFHKTAEISPSQRNPPPWILKHADPQASPSGSLNSLHSSIRTSKEANRDGIFGTVQLTPPATISPYNNSLRLLEMGSMLDRPQPIHEAFTSMNTLLLIGAIFLMANCLFFLALYYKCRKYKQSTQNRDVSRPAMGLLHSHKTGQRHHHQHHHQRLNMMSDCNLLKLIRFSRSDDVGTTTFGASSTKTSDNSKCKLTRQMSSSTIDAHTKVRDWITQEVASKFSPKAQTGVRRLIPCHRPPSAVAAQSTNIIATAQQLRPAISTQKVSVAVDATPASRGASVAAQLPIELAKAQMRLALHSKEGTCSSNAVSQLRQEEKDGEEEVVVVRPQRLKNAASVQLHSLSQQQSEDTASMVIRIDHGYSKSEPVQDLYSTIHRPKRLRTFDPDADINVTSLEANTEEQEPLSPEESLMTIKRRNFPKVLPDYPALDDLSHKRRSMPLAKRFPPIPPPRGTSTLTRQQAVAVHHNDEAVGGGLSGCEPYPSCSSAPALAKQNPSDCELDEPELVCNTLYVGPIVPRTPAATTHTSTLDRKTEPKSKSKIPLLIKTVTKDSSSSLVSADRSNGSTESCNMQWIE